MPLSFSQISLYQTCPKQYEFACVKKIPRGISAGESFGSSVHNALAKWGALEEESGKPKEESHQMEMFGGAQEPEDTELTLDLLHTLWHQSFITEGYNSKEDADTARVKGEKVMEQFYNWWSSEERVVAAVETGFTLELGIRGRFDRVENVNGGVRVIDFKTGAVRTQESVDSDLQLSIYALAAQQEFNVPCTELTLLFLDENGFTERKTIRSKQQLEDALSAISTISGAIDTEDFTPTPSERACGKCPYRNVCNAAM